MNDDFIPSAPPPPPGEEANDPLLRALRERLGEGFGQEPPARLWVGIRRRLPPAPTPWWRRSRRLLPLLALLLVGTVAVWQLARRQPNDTAATPAASQRPPASGQTLMRKSGFSQDSQRPNEGSIAQRGSATPPAGSAAEAGSAAGAPVAASSGGAASAAVMAGSAKRPPATSTTSPALLGGAVTASSSPVQGAARVRPARPPAAARFGSRLQGAASSSGWVRPSLAIEATTRARLGSKQPLEPAAAATSSRRQYAFARRKALGSAATLPELAAASSARRGAPKKLPAGSQFRRQLSARQRERIYRKASLADTSGQQPLATATTARLQLPRASQPATTTSKSLQAPSTIQPDQAAAPAGALALLAPLSASANWPRLGLPTPLAAADGPNGPWPVPSRRWAVQVMAGPTISYRTITRRGLGSPVPTTFTNSSAAADSGVVGLERPALGWGAQVQLRRVLAGRWALAAGLGYQEYATRLALDVTTYTNPSAAVATPVTTAVRQRDTYRLLTLPVQLTYLLGPHGPWQLGVLGGAEPSLYLGGRTTENSGCNCQQQTFTSASGSPYRSLSLALSLGLDVRYHLGGPASRWLLLAQPTGRYVLTPFVRSDYTGYAQRQPYSLGLLLGTAWEW